MVHLLQAQKKEPQALNALVALGETYSVVRYLLWFIVSRWLSKIYYATLRFYKEPQRAGASALNFQQCCESSWV